MGAVSLSPVSRLFGGEAVEGSEVISKEVVHPDRLFRVHKPDWDIVIRPEQRHFADANAHWLGDPGRGCDDADNLVNGRGSSEVRGEGDMRRPCLATEGGADVEWIEQCDDRVGFHEPTLWHPQSPGGGLESCCGTVVPPAGIEPATKRLEGSCSIR